MLFARDFRDKAREALSGKWAVAVGTGFVAALLGVGSQSGGSGGGSNRTSNRIEDVRSLLDSQVGRMILAFLIAFLAVLVIWALFAFVVGGAVTLGYCRFNVNLIQGTDPKFADLFSRMGLFWKALGLRIMMFIFIFLWTLLFIIPGIIASYRYSMAYYIMEENPSIGIIEAITKSKEMMVGNKWRLFCLQISFIGWFFLSILTCGIGFLWLAPYYYAAEAAFYLEISRNSQNVASESFVNA